MRKCCNIQFKLVFPSKTFHLCNKGNFSFQYVIALVLLLIGKCSLCLIVVFWPQVLGIDVRAPRLLRALQRSYALPGREQFTAALDLAQTSVSLLHVDYPIHSRGEKVVGTRRRLIASTLPAFVNWQGRFYVYMRSSIR